MSECKHACIAQRFVSFKTSLDTIASTYVVPKRIADKIPLADLPSSNDLKRHLTALLAATSKQEDVCVISNLADGAEGGNPRIAIPSTIIASLRSANCAWPPITDRPKVPASWVACWLANVEPERVEGWERLEVSHICRMNTCVKAEHLFWETKSVNQSRGNEFCRRACVHPGCTSVNVCQCQGFHDPHCI